MIFCFWIPTYVGFCYIIFQNISTCLHTLLLHASSVRKHIDMRAHTQTLYRAIVLRTLLPKYVVTCMHILTCVRTPKHSTGPSCCALYSPNTLSRACRKWAVLTGTWRLLPCQQQHARYAFTLEKWLMWCVNKIKFVLSSNYAIVCCCELPWHFRSGLQTVAPTTAECRVPSWAHTHPLSFWCRASSRAEN